MSEELAEVPVRDEFTFLLGTALWGWGIGDADAFALLDAYVEAGGVWIDTAVNYPINKRPDDFGRANQILRSWMRSNTGSPLKVSCKIGSVDNSGGPYTALSESDILLSTELAKGCFEGALARVGIHWDNRDNPDEVAATLAAMTRLRSEGYQISFSGIKHPRLYAAGAPNLIDDWYIQVKENLSTSTARKQYTPHFPNAHYLAYGINMGGVKETPPDALSSVVLRGVDEPQIVGQLRSLLADWGDLTPTPHSFNHLALMHVRGNSALSGVILGPRTVDQLLDSLDFIARIDTSPDRDSIRQRIQSQLEGPM